jgi:Na+/H+ antiporter NhaD/arsenite permease-like protein
MTDATVTFAVLIAIVALFIWGRFPVEVVAVGAALVLAATGILTIDQSLAGFGDQVVIFIAALFVVSEGLDSSGVTAWAGQLLIDRSGSSRNRLVILMMVMVAVLTAFVTVNAAVAALLPVVIVIAVRLGIPASKLLIPLCFGSHAGSQLALTGSNVNLLVSNALQSVSTYVSTMSLLAEVRLHGKSWLRPMNTYGPAPGVVMPRASRPPPWMSIS